MSVQANTRIFKGSTLAVAAGLGSTASTGEMVSISGLSAAATEINISTAASDVDEFILGLPDSGEATFNFLLDMDNAFQAEMEIMRDNQETRAFTLTLAEGTINTLIFSGFVIDANITGAVNDVYKMTLVLGISSAIARSAV